MKLGLFKKTGWPLEWLRKGMERKKDLIPNSETLSVSLYFLFIKIYITTFYMEHFHLASCTDLLKNLSLMN